MANWIYTGDISLECGGMFVSLDNWPHYCEVVRVEDLDSGCGFRGAVLIERLSTCLDLTDKKRVASVLSVIGAAMLDSGDISDNGALIERDTEAWKMCLTYAAVAYGCYDLDEPGEVFQLEPDGPMSFDGWRATKRLRNCDLRGFVKAKYLD